ncbi:PpiC-type peptidyl-prolyl cis-trans isomerase [mine drainage metagenome]|uniref:PpiC-type peptidyl-prolyl cis-trans isomerase n=1 Tax=mine drainage metagenome TaxID=410659 RepID=T1D3T9_9ZZZZ
MRHPILSSVLLGTGLLLLGACSHPAKNGTHPSANQAVAIVNGHPIRRGLLDTFLGARGNHSPHLAPAVQHLALQRLIDIQILAAKGRKAGLLHQASARNTLRLQREVLLANLEIRHYLKTHPVTKTDLEQAYQKTVGNMGHHEYKVRHILVKKRALAARLIADLERGAHFSALARKYSVDTSADQGGELGWISAAQVTPSFAKAIRVLKVGAFTRQPVHTQFGWHVIELQAKRNLTPPSFAQMHDRLLDILRNKEITGFITHLRGQTKVKILLPNVPPAPPTRPGMPNVRPGMPPAVPPHH